VGKRALLDAMPPIQFGGNMIADVTFEKTAFQAIPNKFEAGTGNIADAVGLGAALGYVSRIGIEQIGRHEHALLACATAHLGHALNEEGMAVRTGHHCAQPILRRFGVETTVRAPLAFYNTFDEIDRLAIAVARLARQRPTASTTMR
jgi:cysteine desulfurase/selenocysteine lyase